MYYFFQKPLWLYCVLLCMLIAGCTHSHKIESPETSLALTSESDTADSYIPEPLIQTSFNTPLKQRVSVEFRRASVSDALKELARQCDLLIEIAPDINGEINLQAEDQTLEFLLITITERLGLRYELAENSLSIHKDYPYLKNYKVPYLNISRSSKAAVSLSVELGASGAVSENEGVASTNNSSSAIDNLIDNQFWESLEKGLGQLLKSDKSARFVTNRSVGLVSVKAKQKNHRMVSSYLSDVLKEANRQVLIEATVVEVGLDHNFNSGIDWKKIASNGGELVLNQKMTRNNLLASNEQFNINFINKSQSLQSTVRLLEQFGQVKVLSSPKIMALNNQPSILKVVDNRVYFRLDVDTTTASGGATATTIETNINTIPVGFMMSVTPFVDEHDDIMLNVRPTISRIIRFVNDPNPVLAANQVVSQIPEIQVREIETVLRIKNGEIAVLGGLMQNSEHKNTDQLPWLAKIPVLGALFKGKDNRKRKSELVVFLRAVKNEQPSVNTDFENYSNYFLKGA